MSRPGWMRAIAAFGPWRRAGREVLHAVIAGIAATAIAVIALRVPITALGERWLTGGADQVLHYAIFTSAGDVFPYFANDRLGFPEAQNLFFAPLFDLWSAIFATVVGQAFDGIVTLNLYYVVTFFTTAAAATLFFRALRVRASISIVFGVIFALIPYHFAQIALGHPFLANMWPVAAIGVLCLVVAGPATDPFDSWISAAQTRRMRLSRRWIPIALLALAVALSQSYYYVFAAILVGGIWLFGVIRTLLTGQRIRTLLWPTATLVSLVGAIGVQLAILSLNWGDRYEKYFSGRTPGESELYGGKLTSLILPWTDSGIPLVGDLARAYAEGSPIAPLAEGPWTAILASVGMVALMLWIFVRLGITASIAARASWILDPRIAVLAIGFVWGFLFYLTAGLGAVFAFVVSPEIRAWSRMGVVLSLFGLAFVAIVLQRVLTGVRSRVIVLALVSAFALVDQTLNVNSAFPLVNTPDTGVRAMVNEVVELLPEDCGVVEVPTKSFPEGGNVGSMGDYDESFPYIYGGDELRWSYGAVRGTEAGDFWDGVDTPREFEAAIDDSGACAVLVDQYAYQDDPDGWESELGDVVDPDAPLYEDDRYLLFAVEGG